MIKKIAIVCGGYSGEYEVSIGSAKVMKNYIDKSKYEAYIVIVENKEWFCRLESQKIPLDKNDFSIKINNEKIEFDAVLNLIHGTPGEDGKLQGYLDMLNIPQSACSVFTSALTFKKNFCNSFVKSLDIVAVAKSITFSSKDIFSTTEILQKIKLPCFAKPNKGGSSVGISKVKTADELIPAIKLALKEDDEVMLEEMIDGIELTCGVIWSRGEIITFPITEIISKNDFFDYAAKYTKGMAEEITPARVSIEISNECQRISSELYKYLDCTGIVRFDYILSKNTLYFLEVNTIPGMSEASIVPKQAKEYGMSLTELIDRILEEII